MLESPKFRFALYEGGNEYDGEGRRYKAVGISINELGTSRVYRMTLPIEPSLPIPTEDGVLVEAAMTSLRYLCANLPDEDA